VSACGSETLAFGSPPQPHQSSITTVLTGGGQRGAQITVPEGAAVTDTATISAGGERVSGLVSYAAYASPECESRPIWGLGEGGETNGTGPASNAVTLPPGKYYFRATYTGSPDNKIAGSTAPCGAEVLTVLGRSSSAPAKSGGGIAPPPLPTTPSSQFALEGARVNAQNGQILLTAQFSAAGLAGALAVVQQGASVASATHVGARRAGQRCRRGLVRLRKRCVSNAPVTYGAASLSIPSPGIYTIVIKPGKRALEALRKGRRLSVTATVTFQNGLGGKAAKQSRSVYVKLATAAKHRRR
jgi:hypothetical protein